MEKQFKTYSDYARAWAYHNGIKIRCFDSTKQTINPNAFYLIRVTSNPIRLVDPHNVRNCLEVTCDPDICDRDFLKYLIISKLPRITRLKMGSCQQFIRKDTVLLALSGAYNERLQGERSVLYHEFA